MTRKSSLTQSDEDIVAEFVNSYDLNQDGAISAEEFYAKNTEFVAAGTLTEDQAQAIIEIG